MDWQVFIDLWQKINLFIKQAERNYYNQQVMANKDNSGSMWKTSPLIVLNTQKTSTPWQTNLTFFLFLPVKLVC